MNEHHLVFSAIPSGHPGERREPAERHAVVAAFRRAPAEAELLRARLDRFNSGCDKMRGAVGKPA